MPGFAPVSGQMPNRIVRYNRARSPWTAAAGGVAGWVANRYGPRIKRSFDDIVDDIEDRVKQRYSSYFATKRRRTSGPPGRYAVTGRRALRGIPRVRRYYRRRR